MEPCRLFLPIDCSLPSCCYQAHFAVLAVSCTVSYLWAARPVVPMRKNPSPKYIKSDTIIPSPTPPITAGSLGSSIIATSTTASDVRQHNRPRKPLDMLPSCMGVLVGSDFRFRHNVWHKLGVDKMIAGRGHLFFNLSGDGPNN